MADNITITSGANSTPPANTIVATDEVGSAHYQIIKVALGADGSASLLGIGQQTMANSLPVVLSSNQASIPVVLNTSGSVVGATQDAGPNWSSSLGVDGVRVTSSNMSSAAVSVTGSPTSGQKIVVDDIVVSADTAMRVDFKEETSGTIKAGLYLPANGTAQVTTRGKFKLDTADKKLQAQTSASGNIAITVLYHAEA